MKILDNIIQQNNYTNTYLKHIGEQLERIEDYINPSYNAGKKMLINKGPLF